MTRSLYLLSVWLLIAVCWTSTTTAQTLSAELVAVADIIVDQNGTGDFLTVQEALTACPDSSEDWTVVYVKNGTYYEKVVLGYKKTHVVLVGEHVDSTIITYDDHADAVLPGHTFSSYTFRADAHDFQAYNITFANPETQSQAVAFHSNGDRQILYHCKLLGYQDTYFDNFRTRRYIKDTYIEGAVDYIFGFGVTLFDSCQINTISSGYITAAATPQYYEFGYVFKNCWLTINEGSLTNVFLGRPWFPYSNTVFFETWQTNRLSWNGWKDWDGRGATALYFEYNCTGPGFRPDKRISFGRQLDSSLAWRYNIDTIFAASNFPADSGYVVDSVELWSMRDRFTASGYTERADTILYAGRDTYPSYPTDNWSPVFYDSVYSVVRDYTTPFGASVVLNASLQEKWREKYGLEVLSPVEDALLVSSRQLLPETVTITLYDMSGKSIFAKKLNRLPAGRTKVSLGSLEMPQGVYFYQIEASEFQTGGKLIKR